MVPMPCACCGKPHTRFFGFDNAARPDICERCLQQMVKLVHRLVERRDA